MARLNVYVHSFELPTVDVVDREGAMHACAQAQSTAFQSLGRLAGLFGNRYLCDEDRETLATVEDFCRKKSFEYSVIDLGTMSFVARLGLRVKGIGTPTVCCGERMFHGVPSEDKLTELLIET